MRFFHAPGGSWPSQPRQRQTLPAPSGSAQSSAAPHASPWFCFFVCTLRSLSMCGMCSFNLPLMLLLWLANQSVAGHGATAAAWSDFCHGCCMSYGLERLCTHEGLIMLAQVLQTQHYHCPITSAQPHTVQATRNSTALVSKHSFRAGSLIRRDMHVHQLRQLSGHAPGTGAAVLVPAAALRRPIRSVRGELQRTRQHAAWLSSSPLVHVHACVAAARPPASESQAGLSVRQLGRQ